jgi:hypothetical protein
MSLTPSRLSKPYLFHRPRRGRQAFRRICRLTRISHQLFEFAIGSLFFLDFSVRAGNLEEVGLVLVKTDVFVEAV